MSEGDGGSDFSIDLPLREVLRRVDRYMLDWGFNIGLNRTAGTAEYGIVRHKRFPLRLLARSPDFYRVRFSIREEEEGRTRLTVKTSQRGRWPEDVRDEIERWIIDELGGVPTKPDNNQGERGEA
jgi:hypothetical protein